MLKKTFNGIAGVFCLCFGDSNFGAWAVIS